MRILPRDFKTCCLKGDDLGLLLLRKGLYFFVARFLWGGNQGGMGIFGGGTFEGSTCGCDYSDL